MFNVSMYEHWFTDYLKSNKSNKSIKKLLYYTIINIITINLNMFLKLFLNLKNW